MTHLQKMICDAIHDESEVIFQEMRDMNSLS